MGKRGIASIIIFIIVIIVVASGVVVYVSVSGNGGDLPCGLSVKGPAGWEFVPMSGNSFAYRSSLDSEEDLFMENVIVDIQNLTGLSLDMDAFTELSLGQIKGVELLESKDVTLAGLDGYRVVTVSGQTKLLITWTVVGDSAYVVTYTAQTSSYDKYLGDAEGVITSLEIDGDCYTERGGEGVVVDDGDEGEGGNEVSGASEIGGDDECQGGKIIIKKVSIDGFKEMDHGNDGNELYNVLFEIDDSGIPKDYYISRWDEDREVFINGQKVTVIKSSSSTASHIGDEYFDGVMVRLDGQLSSGDEVVVKIEVSKYPFELISICSSASFVVG